MTSDTGPLRENYSVGSIQREARKGLAFLMLYFSEKKYSFVFHVHMGRNVCG
jgi:hypothetical protein